MARLTLILRSSYFCLQSAWICRMCHHNYTEEDHATFLQIVPNIKGEPSIAQPRCTSSSGYTVGLSSQKQEERCSGVCTSVRKRVWHTWQALKVGSLVLMNTHLKGALDLVATLVSKEDWNQPPSWSFPSRYKSALCWVPEIY